MMEVGMEEDMLVVLVVIIVMIMGNLTQIQEGELLIFVL
jgi:hypothetical protein